MVAMSGMTVYFIRRLMLVPVTFLVITSPTFLSNFDGRSKSVSDRIPTTSRFSFTTGNAPNGVRTKISIASSHSS